MPRPHVYINMAMTADGKITSARREYPRFTSRYDRDNMDRLRAEADALLVGAGTMRADNPKLGVRDEKMQELRASLGKPPTLDRILLTRSAAIPEESRFFEDDGARRIVATVEDAPEENLRRLGDRAEVWRLGRGQVDLDALMTRLDEIGVQRLLVEGGGEVNWCFVSGDLVDELFVTLAPTLLGGVDAPTLLEGAGFSMIEQRRLHLVGLHREGNEIYCRYAVKR